MHTENSFITLTYDNQHVPTDFSVDLPALQRFFKRLRKHLRSKKIRYFACGEYGDNTLRPHYHSLIFGHAFPDKKLHAVRKGRRYYKSDKLNELWDDGDLNEITDVTYQTAGYVARYNHKKIVGEKADDHYTRVSPVDGQIYRVREEFLTMSTAQGIGQTWFNKYRNDVFPSDHVIVDGKKHKVPRFYLKQLEEDVRDRLLADHKQQTNIKRKRKRQSLKRRDNNTRERLAVREEVQRLRVERLNQSRTL